MLHPGGKSHLLEGAGEMPVLSGLFHVAYDFDLVGIAAAQAHLMRQADVFDGQRIDAQHHLGRHCVDGHLIGAGQDYVLDVGDHGSGAGAVTGERAIHHREHA